MQIGLPTDLSWYKLLTDWGSLIGGVFALIAGAAAYFAGKAQAKATWQAAYDQLAANDRKDRLQAHCIAVGIYPELLAVKVSSERASKLIREEFQKVRMALTTQTVALIRDVRIFEPPLVSQSIDQLYILGESGATILQLLSVILQYNHMVETLAKRTQDDVNAFWASYGLNDLSGHLDLITKLLETAEREIAPIHDTLPSEQLGVMTP